MMLYVVVLAAEDACWASGIILPYVVCAKSPPYNDASFDVVRQIKTSTSVLIHTTKYSVFTSHTITTANYR